MEHKCSYNCFMEHKCSAFKGVKKICLLFVVSILLLVLLSICLRLVDGLLIFGRLFCLIVLSMLSIFSIGVFLLPLVPRFFMRFVRFGLFSGVLMKSKMVSISVRVPEWALEKLQRVAWEREWSVSHLVRFLVCGSIEAWEHDASVNPEVQREDI